MSDKYYGLYLGTITDINDPDGAMRIKVMVPEVLGDEISSWALPCVPPGARFVPEINTRVWIAFEAGDPSRPVWVGTLGGSSSCVVRQMQDFS